jgi:hypothetical protein
LAPAFAGAGSVMLGRDRPRPKVEANILVGTPASALRALTRLAHPTDSAPSATSHIKQTFWWARAPIGALSPPYGKRDQTLGNLPHISP